MKHSHILVGIVILVILLDQCLKFYIKTTLSYGSGFEMLGLNWARIHFVENEGMAFGITFSNKCIGIKSDGGCRGIMLTPESAKLLLSLFRLVMVGFLIYLIRELIRNKESLGLLICFALILAGALGNIIDSAFYGMIFSESSYHGQVAELFPDSGGYSSFLHGKVVDMFYFPIIDTILPDGIPFFGGQRLEFFKPVFNIADSAITVGVATILLFHRNFLAAKKKEDTQSSDEAVREK